MKKIWTIVGLGAVLALTACGSSNSSNGSINGNWTASLMSQSNSNTPLFNFSLNMTQMSSGSLSITNLSFNSGGNCFTGGASATGGFSLSGNFNGNTSGALQMNIQSNSGSNQLTLTGTVNNNTITGNWSLSGTTAGCTGSGTFTMDKS